jgi:hypothetical protein
VSVILPHNACIVPWNESVPDPTQVGARVDPWVPQSSILLIKDLKFLETLMPPEDK